MKFNIKALLAAASVATFALSPANAYEGQVAQTKPGIFIGASAGDAAAGHLHVQPGFHLPVEFGGPLILRFMAPRLACRRPSTYRASFSFPAGPSSARPMTLLSCSHFRPVSFGQPFNIQSAGMFNTYFVPIELSWMKIGGTGFGIKTGFGIYAPTGTHSGRAGFGNVGALTGLSSLSWPCLIWQTAGT